jgi:GT2 family glycosyltransferase
MSQAMQVHQHARTTRVLVAVLTFRRPLQLEQGLPHIAAQAAALSRQRGLGGERYDVRVLVVDNDPEGSGAAAVPEAGIGSGHIRYALEPTPGISAGRNRAIDEAEDSDVLVFIDDDELPQEHWLARLLETWRSTRAAAVAGRVVPRYERAPDAWILAGDFFVRRSQATGTEISVAAAGNLLLDMGQVRGTGVRFDEQFGMTGGEDTLFTRRLHRTGCRMVWCDESVVEDLIPGDRLSRAWVLLRAWSHGNSTSLIDIHLAHGALATTRTRVVWAARGLVRVLAGGARVLLGYARQSLRDRARGSRTLCRGAGMLAGAVGYAYEEYARPQPAGDGPPRWQRFLVRRMDRLRGRAVPCEPGD